MAELDAYLDIEYNTCIRKGKHKPKHIKHKRYEAKVQKINLIRSKRHKFVYDNYDARITNQKLFDELIQVLGTKDASKWNDEYETLSIYVFKLETNTEYVRLYNDMQNKIEEDYYDEDWCERHYNKCYRRCRYNDDCW